MNEYFLHFIWQYQFFNKLPLKTINDETITILHPGIHNKDQGPDFSHSRILMNGLEWHGNVEIHLKASDWFLHHHETDKNYDTIILHVVWENDRNVIREDDTMIPVLELKGLVNEEMVDRYRSFVDSGVHLPCQYFIDKIPSVHITDMFGKSLIERLERKGAEVYELFKRNNNDWEETFWQILVRNFGFKINNQPFEQLSRSISYKLLLKHSGSQLQLEALLFGQSGLLENAKKDSYSELLQKEYGFLSHKYSLSEHKMESHLWKFLRTRPCNFPTVRIAQLASLLKHSDRLVNLIYEDKTFDEYLSILKTEPCTYWRSHYKFGEKSKGVLPGITDSFVYSILINVILPIKVARYLAGSLDSFPEESLLLLEKMPAEINKISKEWQRIGVKIKSAFDSQAGIEVYNEYCLKRKCLYCSIGTHIIKH